MNGLRRLQWEWFAAAGLALLIALVVVLAVRHDSAPGKPPPKVPATVRPLADGIYIVESGHESDVIPLCDQKWDVDVRPKTPTDPNSDMIVECHPNK